MYVMRIINPLSLRIKEISMNERIRGLAKQAGMLDFSQVSGGRYKVTEVDIEEFAELIVKECIKLCAHESNDDEYDQYDMGMSVKAENIKTAIKKHFGVEE